MDTSAPKRRTSTRVPADGNGRGMLAPETGDHQRMFPLSIDTRWHRVRDWLSQPRNALLVILLVSAGLRMLYLGGLGFNSDEAVYAGQAAAIARDPDLSPLFPIFRAHPLLFHVLLSIPFQLATVDLLARLFAALVGILTVFVLYHLGTDLYGERAGLLAALLLAVMPYHVIVTRQVLLDGPMTLFATLTLFSVVRFARTQHPRWLYASGASIGLTFLAKETGILFVVSLYAFLALSPRIRVRLRDLAGSAAMMLIVILPFPLTLWLAGGGSGGRTQQYLIWQLSRRPNHEWPFYPQVLFETIGPAVLLLALLGLTLVRQNQRWKDVLLGAWILVPLMFYQAWPVKGFHYLLAISPALALLAAGVLGRPPDQLPFLRRIRLGRRQALQTTLIVLVVISLIIPSMSRVLPRPTTEFLAGSGGVPGGREAGLWLRDNTPQGSTLMTIGPSMANILQFYGYRRALGLSVSPNPLHRNPAYTPIRNPDFEIRTGEIQYLVWDTYSAGRSAFFSNKLLSYAEKYDGRVVHTETITMRTPTGTLVDTPVIVIYEVRP